MASSQASSLGIKTATFTAGSLTAGWGWFLFGAILIASGVILAVFDLTIDVCFISGHSFIFFGFILFAIGMFQPFIRLTPTQKFIGAMILALIGWIVGWMVVSWI